MVTKLTLDLADQLRSVIPSLDGDIETYCIGNPSFQSDQYKDFLDQLPFRQKLTLSNAWHNIRQIIRETRNHKNDYSPITLNDLKQLQYLIDRGIARDIPTARFFAYVCSPQNQEELE